MNKFSKDAFNISQDIYNIASELERLNTRLNNFEIKPEVYTDNLYFIICKTVYLEEVIAAMKQKGYKFRNYEKEMMILNSITENLNSNFEIANMSNLNNEKLMKGFLDFTKKYNHLMPLEDEDEFDDDLNYNLSF